MSISCFFGGLEMIKAGFKRMMVLLAVMAAVFAMINGSVSADETSSQNSSTVVYSALENAVSKDAQQEYHNRDAYGKASDEKKKALQDAIDYGKQILENKGSQQDVDVALEQINTCLNNLGGKPESLPHTGAGKAESGKQQALKSSAELVSTSRGKSIFKTIFWGVITLGALGLIAFSIIKQLCVKRESNN